MAEDSYSPNHRYEPHHDQVGGEHDGQRPTTGDRRTPHEPSDHARAGERRWQRWTEWGSRR